MTDNEKRAHDLTLVCLTDLARSSKRENVLKSVSSPNDEDRIAIAFDYYANYLEIYKTALSAFNRDFPEGR